MRVSGSSRGFVLAAAMMMTFGCTPAEIIVVIDAEPSVQTSLADLIVVVEHDQRPVELWDRADLVRLGDGGLLWPTIVRVSQDGGDGFRVEARAILADGRVISASAAPNFVDGQRRSLRLVLREHCAGIVCDEGMACVASPACSDQECCHAEDEAPLDSYDAATTVREVEDMPSCFNEEQDGEETDIDCGGVCVPCGLEVRCEVPDDCSSGFCGDRGFCLPASCGDGVQNAGESDRDCGGPCDGCSADQFCAENQDCMSSVCSLEGRCLAPSCGNAVTDGSETDMDCGGACDPCASGSTCDRAIDCASRLCDDGRCSPPTCANGMQDEGETDLDCGGPCAGCGAGEACLGATDCRSGACRGSGICRDACVATIGVDCDRVSVSRLASPEPSVRIYEGGAVAIDGDLMAIGAPGRYPNADDPREHAGRVHIYRRVAGSWEHEAAIEAPAPRIGDAFGFSVSLVAGQLLVGAPFAGRGMVYQFERVGESWALTDTLTPDASEPETRFGAALDRDGDRLAVGAPDDANLFGRPAGRVEYYERAGGVWTLRHLFRPTETAPSMGYGEAVALAGELLAVGAPGHSGTDFRIDGSQNPNGSDSSGAVFVYRQRGSDWVPEVFLKASNGSVEHRFGQSVDTDGDRVLVGAPDENSGGRGVDDVAEHDGNAEGSGAAYLFTHDEEGTWTQALHFKAGNVDVGDHLGASVRLWESLVILGARAEYGDHAGVDALSTTTGSPSSGAVYFFGDLPELGWQQTLYLKASDPVVNYAQFATALAFDGETLVVGAPFETAGGLTRVGAAYAYDFRRALAPEVCDGFDNDGNGGVDETFAECSSGCEAGLCR